MTPSRLRQDALVTPLDDLSGAMYANIKLDSLLPEIPEHTHQDSIAHLHTQDGQPTSSADKVDIVEDYDTLERTKSEHTASSSGEFAKNSGNSSITSQWKLKQVLAGAHLGWVRSLAVDQVTNEWFVSGLADGLIKVWDLVSGEVRASISGHIMGVRALAVSNKYPYLFSGSEDKTVRCWDLERTNLASGCQIRNYHGHVGGIYAMALHPELDLLFTAGRDSAIRVWDIRTRHQVMVLTGHRSDVTGLAAQIGDPQVVSSSMDSTVRLWDLRKQTTQLTLTHHTKSVRLLAMHPNEMTMATADSSGNIKEWVLPGGQLLDSFGEIDDSSDANIINTLAINPATDELFAGYSDGRMKFYDYKSGRMTQAVHSTPAPGSSSSTIYASTFDMLGMRLLTAESDKSIKIWSV